MTRNGGLQENIICVWREGLSVYLNDWKIGGKGWLTPPPPNTSYVEKIFLEMRETKDVHLK